MKRKSAPRYSIDKNKYLNDLEVASLNHVLDSFKDKDSRNCTLLWTMLHTGARATEALNIMADDLNDLEMSVYIRGIKQSENREIPVPTWLFKRLKGLAEPGKPLFQISYQRLDQIWREYRPVAKKLHGLRHTFAIRMYKRTKDLRLLQVALGHRNINNTMVYANYLYNQQELRKLIVVEEDEAS